MKYKIFRIEEQMYGCEEPPADQPILVDVVLEGADGTRRVPPTPTKRCAAAEWRKATASN